jgi:hypothetical protein
MEAYSTPLFVVIPLAGAFLIALFGKKLPVVPDLFSNLCTLTAWCSTA